MIETVRQFFMETLWRMDTASSPWFVRAGLFLVRFISLTVRCYLRDGSRLHASALTYITMLAVVPVLTLGLTSLKAFGAGELARERLMENIESFVGKMEQTGGDNGRVSAPEELDKQAVSAPSESVNSIQVTQAANALRNVCETIFEQIDSINFAKIGTVGAVALIFMVIGVLGKIENSFNAIWGIEKARPIWRKFTDYLSVIIIAPLLVLAATSLPVLDRVARMVPDLWGLHGMIENLGIFNRLVPLCVGSLLFAFLFGFLPNTRVRILSCFIGAFLTTIILAVFFKFCMVLQIGIASNSRLYGSLIALPILLFWIYSSWQIILLGAELCYVHQHYTELLRESAFTHPSERDLIVLALALVLWAARCVEEQACALSVAEFSDTFAVPERDVERVAVILERNHILLPVSENGSTVPAGYVLCQCATRLTIADVINACLDDTSGEAVIRRAEAFGHLGALSSLEQRFSQVLTSQFSITVAEALQTAKKCCAV